MELYRFDEKLRALLFAVIARIEVKLRSRLDHTLSSLSNNPFWYLDNTFFYTRAGTAEIDGIRAQIQSDFSKEQELYAKSYRNKYHNNVHATFTLLPPFWIASEIITIGCLLKIFKAIDFSYFKGLGAPQNKTLDNLANEFGAKDFDVLVNWIQRLRDVRNRCAHHSRLWNARLAIPSKIANELSLPPIHANRPYLTICIIQKMITSLGLTGMNLKHDLELLFQANHAARLYMHESGFPANWATDPFWN